MNAILLSIILIPAIEIYLFIEIGGKIGALYTISLIFLTAIIGVYYARYEGFNTLRSGMGQLLKNELPIYEILSGAALAFAALLIVGGIGFLQIQTPQNPLLNEAEITQYEVYFAALKKDLNPTLPQTRFTIQVENPEMELYSSKKRIQKNTDDKIRTLALEVDNLRTNIKIENTT